MSEAEFKLKATGGEQAKSAIRGVRDATNQAGSSFVQLNKVNPFSEKNSKLSTNALKETVKLYKEQTTYINKATKELREMAKVYEGIRRVNPADDRLTEIETRERKIHKRVADSYRVREKAADLMGGRPPEEEEGGGGGIKGFLAKKFGPAAIMTAATVATWKAVHAASAYQDQMLELAGTMRGNDVQVGKFVDSMKDMHGTITNLGLMGYNAAESASTLNQFARAGLSPDVRGGPGRTVEAAMRFQREGVPVESFLNMTQAGVRGGRQTRGTDIMYVMKDAVESGVTDAIGQTKFVDSVTNLTETLQQQGANVSPDVMSQLMRVMGQAGGPMFQANMGGNALQTFNQSFMNPGGGVAGNLFMSRVGGLGKGKTWWQSQLQLAKGIADPANIVNELKEARDRSGGDTDQMAMILNKVVGFDPLRSQKLAEADKGGALEKQFAGADNRVKAQVLQNFLDSSFSPSLAFQDKITGRGAGDYLEKAKLSAAGTDALIGAGNAILTKIEAGISHLNGIATTIQTKLHIGAN